MVMIKLLVLKQQGLFLLNPLHYDTLVLVQVR